MTRQALLSSAATGAAAEPPAILIEQETADYLRVSTRTLQRLRLSGDGPKYLAISERRIAYRLEDLETWVASRVVSSTSQATVARDTAA